MSQVFVLNAGSSSLKHALIDAASGETLAAGTQERLGQDGRTLEAALHTALQDVGARHLVAVAHRVVHGGRRFTGPVLVDDEVVRAIRELAVLAPLHNPANADAIDAARRALGGLLHVAVFDTAFHADMPPCAYTYAVDPELEIRRYGFHGTSHAYVSRAAAAHLGRCVEDLNIVVLHLGNGASACAVQGGRSIDTSMGITPLEGLVMGTRSGDLDPAAVFHLHRTRGLSVDEIDDALNRHGGMLALAGTSDMRDIHVAIAADDRRAADALDVYCYRIRKYVGAYSAALGRVDAVAFTAGIGENDVIVRARALAGLEGFGIAVDDERNAASGDGPRTISPDGAAVAVLVVPTNEELEMARQAAAVIS